MTTIASSLNEVKIQYPSLALDWVHLEQTLTAPVQVVPMDLSAAKTEEAALRTLQKILPTITERGRKLPISTSIHQRLMFLNKILQPSLHEPKGATSPITLERFLSHYAAQNDLSQLSAPLQEKFIVWLNSPLGETVRDRLSPGGSRPVRFASQGEILSWWVSDVRTHHRPLLPLEKIELGELPSKEPLKEEEIEELKFLRAKARMFPFVKSASPVESPYKTADDFLSNLLSYLE